jgi:hypothetical protein
MAMTQKEEARALNAEERDFVEKSHHPALQDLSDEDLSNLVKLVRERRDKAKTQANQRRREMRGKAAPKGATPSKSDDGSKAKLAVLAMAVRRLNSEIERRRRLLAAVTHVESARSALGCTIFVHSHRVARSGSQRCQSDMAASRNRRGF